MSKQSKLQAMRDFCAEHKDMPDGAFFQLAKDIYGWTAEDFAWLAERVDELERKP